MTSNLERRYRRVLRLLPRSSSTPGRPRLSSVVATGLAVVGLVFGVASCTGQITPLGPAGVHSAPALPPPRHLGSPITLQVIQSRQPAATGGCPAGWLSASPPPDAAPMPCYRPVGTAVTITSAAVSQVSASRQAPSPGQPAQPASYGFIVGVPAGQVAGVTALIRQAYNSRDALGISVDGKLLQAPQVGQPFSGQQFQISLLSRKQALQLYRLLIPAG